MTEEKIKCEDSIPKDYKVRREWQGVTLEDIDSQWAKSKDVHPSFGQQLAHFAAGIDRTLKERNHD
jgi:hypothetical protein